MIGDKDGRAPSGFDPSRYEVGQRLWLVPRNRYRSAHWVTVEKIGRKWVSILGGGRVELGKRYIDGGDYFSPARLYASPEDHAAEVALHKKWGAVRQRVDRFYGRPPHLTPSKLDQLFALLSDSDGSPEDGDACGSVHDSAAIMPHEYEDFCKRIAEAAVTGSARSALKDAAPSGEPDERAVIVRELYEALERLLPYFEGEHSPDHPDTLFAQAAATKARNHLNQQPSQGGEG